jgi:hypothetical protein
VAPPVGDDTPECAAGHVYNDITCGPPPVGCALIGDGLCYKLCESDADCCELHCRARRLVARGDTAMLTVMVCQDPK